MRPATSENIPIFTRTVFVDDSENVHKVRYDTISATMLVEFVSGRSYLYRGVDSSDFGGLVSAESVGSYLNKQIKNKYSYVEVK